MVIIEGVTIAFIYHDLLKRLSLAFVRHTDTVSPRCVVFNVYEAGERELTTFSVRRLRVVTDYSGEVIPLDASCASEKGRERKERVKGQRDKMF
jgi:hypothetical protein